MVGGSRTTSRRNVQPTKKHRFCTSIEIVRFSHFDRAWEDEQSIAGIANESQFSRAPLLFSGDGDAHKERNTCIDVACDVVANCAQWPEFRYPQACRGFPTGEPCTDWPAYLPGTPDCVDTRWTPAWPLLCAKCAGGAKIEHKKRPKLSGRPPCTREGNTQSHLRVLRDLRMSSNKTPYQVEWRCVIPFRMLFVSAINFSRHL